jgi:hypothetical protein
MNKKAFLLPVIILLTMNCFSQNQIIVNRAAAFLQSLSDSQRIKAQYNFDADERYSWHYIPKKDRKGIMLNELNEKQKEAGFSILKYYLSDEAFGQTKEIIQLENVLHEMENRQPGDGYRNPGNYTFLFFGQPSDTSKWGWRFEGHHISFNFSSMNGKLVSGTPGFMGSNPAVVLSGPQKGKEVLKSETELGFALLNSFTPKQLSIALSKAEAPGEIITGNSRKAVLKTFEGLSFAAFNKQQQQIFFQLLSVYIQRYTKKFADDLMQEIESAGLNNLYFLWAGTGAHEAGKGYYYRVHGPTILIEYDNTQNKANHIHTVIRDLKHDFGGDELWQHYQTEH